MNAFNKAWCFVKFDEDFLNSLSDEEWRVLLQQMGGDPNLPRDLFPTVLETSSYQRLLPQGIIIETKPLGTGGLLLLPSRGMMEML